MSKLKTSKHEIQLKIQIQIQIGGKPGGEDWREVIPQKVVAQIDFLKCVFHACVAIISLKEWNAVTNKRH